MALADTLESSFGLDLIAKLGEMSSAMTGMQLPAVQLDGLSFGSVDASFDGISSAVGAVKIAPLPDPQSLLGPVTGAIQLAKEISAPGRLSLLTDLAAAASANEGSSGFGFDGARASLSALRSATALPGVRDVLRLLAPLMRGTSLDSLLANAPVWGLAIAETADTTGSMMAMHGRMLSIRDGAQLVGGILALPEAEARIASAVVWRDSGLADEIASADPNDAGSVSIVARRAEEALHSIRELADVAVRGLAFGEASLAHARIGALLGELDLARQKLGATRHGELRTIAEQISSAAESLVPNLPASPFDSLDAAWARATEPLAQIATAVSELPIERMTQPIGRAIETVLGPIRDINRAIGEVTAAIRGAFETARAAIESIDVASVVAAVQRFLDPIRTAIEAIVEQIEAAAAGIEAAMAAIRSLLGGLKSTLGDVRDQIDAAFTAVQATIEALDLETVVSAIKSGIGAVVEQLESAQLAPFFDTAIDVMNTGADALELVPLDLLPDSAQQDLERAVAPIKAIDYEQDVVEFLRGEMRAILEELDTTVLDEIEAAYQQVVAFLDSIDPTAEIQKIEAETFDPFLAALQSLDPDEILRPIGEALDSIKGELSNIDISTAMLAPIEAIFDEALAGLDALDPAALLAPVREEVDTVRAQVIEALAMDAWADAIEEVATAIGGAIDRIDLAPAIAYLSAGFDELQAGLLGPTNTETSVLGSLIAALLGAAGFEVRPHSFSTAVAWIRGETDGAAEIKSLLALAIGHLESARQVAEVLDAEALSASLQPMYRSISDALAAHPQGSLLRITLDPAAARSNPLDLLAPIARHRSRYLGKLDADLDALRSLANAGFSEIPAASDSMRTAMAPLSKTRLKLLQVVGLAGVDVVNLSLSGIVRELMSFLRPERFAAPFIPIVAAFREKIRSAFEDVIGPVRDGAAELRALIDAIDVGVIVDDLALVHAAIRSTVSALRPSLILGPSLAALESLKAELISFDPLSPIRATVDETKAAIAEIGEMFRPSVLLAPIVATYDHIIELAGGLNVREILEPVIAALGDIELQLEEGLERSTESFERLQEALP